MLRVLILGVTIGASVKWIKQTNEDPPLVLMALWCAALYMVLPGAKSRYAIYALPSLLVMIAHARFAMSLGNIANGRRIGALALIAGLLLLQAVPDALLTFGIGFVGQIILWVYLLQTTLSTERLPGRASENHTAGGKRTADVL